MKTKMVAVALTLGLVLLTTQPRAWAGLGEDAEITDRIRTRAHWVGMATASGTWSHIASGRTLILIVEKTTFDGCGVEVSMVGSVGAAPHGFVFTPDGEEPVTFYTLVDFDTDKALDGLHVSLGWGGWTLWVLGSDGGFGAWGACDPDTAS